MSTSITRRGFLQLCAASLAGIAFLPGQQNPVTSLYHSYTNDQLGRVATYSVSVYRQPNDKSAIVCQRYRDELLNLYYEVISEDGPSYNPRWYRVWQGYVHSAHIQKVKYRLNPVLKSIPRKYQLAEVTVPFTQVMRKSGKDHWEPFYRLYMGSTHWIVGIDPGPDGSPWYRLHDELTEVEYHVQAEHLRAVTDEELSPISPDVPPEKKHIEVSIDKQTLTAYEYDKAVFQTRISSGIPTDPPDPHDIPTRTPTGSFRIENKMPSKHMGDGNLTADLEAYELPGVPWTSFFEPKVGIAFHGTYWHDNFGVPMSHGCVNMRTQESKWIFRWTTPVYKPGEINTIGWGTVVNVS